MARKKRNKILKRCSLCRKGIRHWNKSGLCQICYRKEYRKRDYIKEKNRIYQEKYRSTEYGKNKQKEWYKKNKEKILKKMKEDYQRKKMERLNNEKSV